MKLGDISIQFCQKQANHWHSYYKKYSNLIGLTTQIIDYAITLKYTSNNPMKFIIKPKKKQVIDEVQFDNYYRKEELIEFLQIVNQMNDTELITIYNLLSFTGMRKGELLGLRWKDINFIEEELSIRQTLTTGINNRLIFQTPKTRKNLRTISLDKKTLKLLKIWKIKQKELMFSYGFKNNNPEQLLITNEDNSPKYLDFINHNFDKIIKNNRLRKISVHGLRHTHCSLLFESGASIKEVQDGLGHTDIKTTMDIYTHVTKKAKEKTADNFAKFMESY